MALHEHELYIDTAHKYSIQCRKCNSKWRVKDKTVRLTIIPLFLIGLSIVIIGISHNSILTILIGVAFWGEAKRPWNVIALMLSIFRIDLTRVKGEQYIFDFDPDREPKAHPEQLGPE